jgi:hypothetical protein
MEDLMFEDEVKEPESSSKLWVGLAVVAAIIVAGIAVFTMTKPGAQNPAAATTRAASTPKAEADPVHDLKVLKATMAKDPSGTVAVWTLTIENRSHDYSYSNIQYSTTYLGATGQTLLVNRGTIAASIDPGEQYKSDVRDTTYPAGTNFYNFVVLGATPKAQ